MNGGDNIVLTKTLLRCQIKANKLQPEFINTNNKQLLNYAEQLLQTCRSNNMGRQEDILEEFKLLQNSIKPLILAKGLQKIVLDRCTFSFAEKLDYPEERKKIFAASANLLWRQNWRSPAEYRATVKSSLKADSPLFETQKLYGDLPENDQLLKFSDINARQLLERYNISLVQGLLLGANKLTLELPSSEAARLRRLLKYLRFFQLLCEISSKRTAKGEFLLLNIDGPASVLKNARSYGLQLANFFPAVCSMENWSLSAEVDWKGKKRELQLDQESKLVCPYHFFTARVPEEVKLFETYFKENVQNWEIIEENQFIKADKNEIIFPDFTFKHKDGTIKHLELFHRWHYSKLQKRLAWLEKQKNKQLIIGVDTALVRKQEIKEEVQNNQTFETNIFFFRNYPNCEKTLKCLNSNPL